MFVIPIRMHKLLTNRTSRERDPSLYHGVARSRNERMPSEKRLALVTQPVSARRRHPRCGSYIHRPHIEAIGYEFGSSLIATAASGVLIVMFTDYTSMENLVRFIIY